jgi:hypothetical protein
MNVAIRETKTIFKITEFCLHQVQNSNRCVIIDLWQQLSCLMTDAENSNYQMGLIFMKPRSSWIAHETIKQHQGMLALTYQNDMMHISVLS